MKAVQDLSDPTGFSDGTRENGDKVSKSLAPNVAWRILLRICGMTPWDPLPTILALQCLPGSLCSPQGGELDGL